MLPRQELGQKASEEQLAAQAAENGEEGGDKPHTQQFQDGKSRRAYCQTNPGRGRYLSLLIPSGMCLKDPEGFIALSFGRPSV